MQGKSLLGYTHYNLYKINSYEKTGLFFYIIFKSFIQKLCVV